MIKKIMLAYSNSERDKKALKQTSCLAKILKSEVYVITVESVPEYAETMDEIQDEVERQDTNYSKINKEALEYLKDRGIKAHSVIAYGARKGKEIITYAKRHNVDLIVIGSKKHSIIGQQLSHIFGCTTGKVLEYAHCSVLVVK